MTNLATKIQWTDATWSPITGCTKVSDGCDHCYITGTPPFRIAHRAFDKPGVGGTTGLLLHPERLTAPLHWAKPRRVFVNSLSDLFHEDVPVEYLAKVFAVMAATPQHTYQILTKRHARMRSLLADRCTCGSGHAPGIHFRSAMSWAASKANTDAVPGLDEHVVYHQAGWPLQNVWLGVSVENQRWANTRIPALLETPAAVRFISAEPLLGPVDFRRLEARGVIMDALGGDVSNPKNGETFTGTPSVLDWIIVGGESGRYARPMDVEWARSIVEQCQPWYEARAFVKQLGSVWATANGSADRKGGDMDEWPAELRVRDYPQTAGVR